MHRFGTRLSDKQMFESHSKKWCGFSSIYVKNIKLINKYTAEISNNYFKQKYSCLKNTVQARLKTFILKTELGKIESLLFLVSKNKLSYTYFL